MARRSRSPRPGPARPGATGYGSRVEPDRTEAPEVTVVVVTWQGAHLLPDCLDSLRRQTWPHRLVVVDNASTDETPDVLSRYPWVTVVRTERNLGFAGGAQLGLEAAGTELVALLNNDATAEPRWLEELVASAQA
ncbi:MAG: glycosyl transferase family 2, partial [Frankiales bacterium]|nr:glycosyl transferase family 2 [Frankiales bacterium]